MKACNTDETLVRSNNRASDVVAIFASGRGSNAMALVDELQCGVLPSMRLACIVTDNPEAAVIDRARARGVEVSIISARSDLKGIARQRELEERQVAYLKKHGVTLICLAGYMRLVGATLLEAFYDADLKQSRILNIHPSLLPNYPGKHAYAQALNHGDHRTGCTVHFVDAGMDTGRIIAQRVIPILPGDDELSLQARGLEQEHQLYRYVLHAWNKEQVWH